jgi:hypothetical protein
VQTIVEHTGSPQQFAQSSTTGRALSAMGQGVRAQRNSAVS